MSTIKQITIQGYKSIQSLENFELNDLNILIGANGAGKLKNTKLTAANEISSTIYRWKIYHFHDTSENAKLKQLQSVSDNINLQSDASNLAPYLKRLQTEYPDNYNQIVKTIKMVAR